MNDRYLKLLCLLFFHTTFVYLDDGSGIGRIIRWRYYLTFNETSA